MDTCIDWLSFTVHLGSGSMPEFGWRWEDVQWHIEQLLGESIIRWLEVGDWEVGHGRAPYASSFRNTLNGVTVFWSGKVSHAAVELSGVGMLAIRAAGLQTELITAVKDNVTRIDLATDILTEVSPLEFAEMRDNRRQKTRGSYTSKTGDTEYIGSRTSERYARVYRYKAPHPRSHLLRVEHECKGEVAKATANALCSHSLEAVQSDLGTYFGWRHPLWKANEQTVSTTALPARHRTHAKTEIWLRSQAASAFKKLVDAGVITDPEAWLIENFLTPLENQD